MSDKSPLLQDVERADSNASAMTETKGAQVAAGSPSRINMKYVSLVMLVVQNASLILLTRYAKTQPGDQFISTTAVVMAELSKMLACFVVVFFEMDKSVGLWMQHMHTTLVVNFRDTLKVAVPAFIYMIQNNLNYVAIGNLPAATFQVSYQLKILTTAIMSVTLLSKDLNKRQWFSLLLLFAGVAIVQLAGTKEGKSSSVEQNQFIGMVAVLMACCCSGFAGVYFEKILKNSAKVSLWTRNIQLGLFGTLTGIIGAFLKDGDKISEHGFFFGYNKVVWAVIFNQAFGGLLVAVVIKYADNILKGFACSLSICVSAVVAYFLFEFEISMAFVTGTSLVISAVYLYSLPAQK